jgi:hypothetical protein
MYFSFHVWLSGIKHIEAAKSDGYKRYALLDSRKGTCWTCITKCKVTAAACICGPREKLLQSHYLPKSSLFYVVWCMVNASCSPLLNVVLVQLLSNTEENDNVMELVSIQDLFSTKFPVETSVNLPVVRPGIPKQVSEFPERTVNVECIDIRIVEGTLLVDLSAYLVDTTQVALPSLNG